MPRPGSDAPSSTPERPPGDRFHRPGHRYRTRPLHTAVRRGGRRHPRRGGLGAGRLANRTEYGLGAALWTTDLDRARRIARVIDAGAVFVNGMVASDPRPPFGGIKKSGYGRELGAEGIREFTNTKTVRIGPAA
ncbi:aldehyde dehydrogenase family protein [Streptomyces sp. NPDC059781]|uniref:aldehyde dehydrogenase family protein n=1 Tax=unclassified Streptomyces TaxID=2593676 RepID=UPI003665F9CA